MDVIQFKAASRKRWNRLAAGCHAWADTLGEALSVPTDRMLDLAGVGEGAHVLDVAAGSGQQTLLAARRVGPRGKVVAADLSEQLVARVSEVAREQEVLHVEARAMDAERLELGSESFDAAISRLGIMLLPNPVDALSELQRVLRPEGKACVMVFTTPDRTPFLGLPLKAIADAVGRPRPSGVPGLFAQGAPGVLEDNFYKAGFERVTTELHTCEFVMKDAAECVKMLRESVAPLHADLEELAPGDQERAWDAVGLALGELEGESGFRSPCEVLLVSGAN